jgi:metal transporter CNNM
LQTPRGMASNCTCACASASVPPPPVDGSSSYGSVAFAACLIVLSGLFSGLNLGLMSVTEDDLRIVIEGSQDAQEVRWAKHILPLRRRGNLLLCTLLLGNTLVNALIAILLDDLTSGGPSLGLLSLGAIITTAVIVIFGEIVPQSVCSRHALAVGSRSLPVVYLFVVLCFPVALPISLILDRILGREISGVFSRQGLLALIRLNVESSHHQKASGITSDDLSLLSGALTFKEKRVDGVMTPIDSCFCLPSDVILNEEVILKFLAKGHTRIPVYEGAASNITGLLFAKDLVGIGFERELALQNVLDSFPSAANRVHRVPRSMTLNHALDKCKRDRVHLLVVVDDDDYVGAGSLASPEVSQQGTVTPAQAPAALDASQHSNRIIGAAVGIATMEDFIEEILGDEIVDETDVYIDNTQQREESRSTRGESSHLKSADAPPPSSAPTPAAGTSPASSSNWGFPGSSLLTSVASAHAPAPSATSPHSFKSSPPLEVHSPQLQNARSRSPTGLNSRRYDAGALVAALAAVKLKKNAAEKRMGWLIV